MRSGCQRKEPVPYKFYQYWLNVADEDTGTCLRFLTELERSEIEALDESRVSAPQERASQRKLAEELTRLIHGPAGLASALQATEIFFGAEIENLDDRQLIDIFAVDVPSCEVPAAELTGEDRRLTPAV